MSLVSPAACGLDTATTSYGDYLGPIEGAVFVVPAGSTQRAISAEAAHLVFAAGAAAGRRRGPIASSDVPQCAMQVYRDKTGSRAPIWPPQLCGCYFDQKTTGHTSCRSCVTAKDCPTGAPACNYGYCEAR
jgi:hypothetical protein